MTSIRTTQEALEVVSDANASLLSTQESLEVASKAAPSFRTTQESAEVLNKQPPPILRTSQESSEILFKMQQAYRTIQESTEVLYRGICNDIGKDATEVAGNWTPTPAHTEVDLGCISSALSPSLDEVVISFAPINWLATYAMEFTIKFHKADSGDTPQSDGDELSLVVEFFDGATSIWSSTFLNVQGSEGRIVHPFSAAEKALISATPDLKVSITADTTVAGTPRKIMVCELGLCSSFVAPPNYLRTTQESAEVLLTASASIRETQSSAEILHSATPISLRETQSAAEVLHAGIPVLRETQGYVEVLSLVPPPPALRETQSSTEVLFAADAMLRETQSTTEVLHSVTPILLRETQSTTEVLHSVVPILRETQSHFEALSLVLDNIIPPDPYEDPDACYVSSLSPIAELFKSQNKRSVLFDPAYSLRLKYIVRKLTGGGTPDNGGDQITVTIRLYDDATLIATWIHADVQGDKSGIIVQTLSAAQKALIASTPNFRVEVTANTTSTGDPRKVQACKLGLYYSGPPIPPPAAGCRMTMFPHRLLRPLCQ